MLPVVSFQDFYNSVWNKIPEIWRSADSQNGKPLEILVLTLSQHLYYTFYLKIAAMDELFDIDRCPVAYLPFLASMVNWKLVGTDVVSWRNQIKTAPLLWKIKGTKKSITLAEKLIGYSVFISELWRDYTGQIVPKEKLWNSFPESTINKPWFRQFSTDIQTDLHNPAFSDILEAYDMSSNEYSTTQQYDPITGAGSTSKLAKASRINVVLKKDLDLDYNINGIFTDSNLQEALSLFLEFKPFHVYINNFLVMYSLSDYVFGSDLTPSAGTGALSGDSILSRESSTIEVAINPEEYITYYNPNIIDSVSDPEVSFNDTSLLKGRLRIVSESFTLPNKSIETNTDYLLSLGFSLSGYARNIQANIISDNGNMLPDPMAGRSLWAPSDFTTGYFPFSNTTGLLDIVSGNIPYASIIPEPKFSFYSYNTKLNGNACSLNQTFSNILQTSNTCNVSLFGTGDYKDSLTINGITVNYSNTTKTPISLSGYLSTYNKIAQTNGVVNNTALYTANISNDLSHWSNNLLATDLLVFITYNNSSYVLSKKLHYNYDSTSNKFVINLYSISLLVGDTIVSNLMSGLTFYIVYPTIESNDASYNIDNITRNTNISSRKNNKKFNRSEFVDNSSLVAYIATTSYSPKLYFDTTSGTLLEDTQNTRNYRTDLPKLFTRSSVYLNDPTGTSYNAVNFDKTSPRDTSLWIVVSSPLTYIGPEQISSTVWSNFFNVPIQDTYYLAKYTDINTSETAQIINRNNTRWQSYLSSISTTHPMYFCSSREDTVERRAIWTRSSASKQPIPYKGASRSSIQGYRKDTALFTRNEYIGNYTVSLDKTNQVDKYKYTDNNDIDYTASYTNSSINDDISVSPQTEILEQFFNSTFSFKTKINNYNITYPIVSQILGDSLQYTPQYAEPFDFCNRQAYYSSSTILKPSFYSNNIRTDTSPYTGSLISETFDILDIDIAGLVYAQDIFSIEDPTVTSFTLTNANVFISWRKVNTGVMTSLSPVYSNTIYPNVSVIKNGIELTYNDFWTISSNPYQIKLTPFCILNVNDVIEVIYNTLDTVKLPTSPAYQDPNNINNFVVCDTVNTKTSVDTIAVPYNFNNSNKQLLLEYGFIYTPVISWYRSDTSMFINTSIDLPVSNIAKTPIPILYKDVAVPDVIVSVNSTNLVYNRDWKFTSIPSATSFAYRVVLKQNITQNIQPNDSISITYTSLNNVATSKNILSIYSS